MSASWIVEFLYGHRVWLSQFHTHQGCNGATKTAAPRYPARALHHHTSLVTEAERVSVRRAMKKRVFARDHYRCRYCGFDMTLHFPYPHLHVLTVDHVRPRSKGGKHAYNNLVTCCRWCNGRKTNRPVEEFLQELGQPTASLTIDIAHEIDARPPVAPKRRFRERFKWRSWVSSDQSNRL